MYVATADLSGLVKVWKVETKEEIWSFECSDIEVRGIPYCFILLRGLNSLGCFFCHPLYVSIPLEYTIFTLSTSIQGPV